VGKAVVNSDFLSRVGEQGTNCCAVVSRREAYGHSSPYHVALPTERVVLPVQPVGPGCNGGPRCWRRTFTIPTHALGRSRESHQVDVVFPWLDYVRE